MRPSNRDLLRLYAEVTERRLTVGELTGTEFTLSGGGVLWIADAAPSWAVQRMLRRCLDEEVHQGFGDSWTVLVPEPDGEVDL